ncbi:hypothetical protein Nepgr_012815 [Nepenthes gracilis]|uniref:GBF-interacting protein 1 N-terminal domain-containing protein n=1 Tax=Nepenthes gracilis TaxID=150966 RepID=A0AAD3SHY2_NEPGR|nr:hypothetical protein Nepgr_012815 [Nepenthes gracilis]
MAPSLHPSTSLSVSSSSSLSSSPMTAGSRLSTIPSNVRKTIQHIKEIFGNHSEEDIYAMLKECSMDPNETTQRLLVQDTFHEVKRKRYRRKENLSNGENADSRWKTGPPGPGSRGSRGNYSPRYAAGVGGGRIPSSYLLSDLSAAGGGRKPASGKENVPNHALEEMCPMSSFSATQEMKIKETASVASSVSVMANGPIGVVSGDTNDAHTSQVSAESVVKQHELSRQKQSHIGVSKDSNLSAEKSDTISYIMNNLSSAGDGSKSASGKENVPNQAPDKSSSMLSSTAAQETENKETAPVSSSVSMANGAGGVVSQGTSDVHTSQVSAENVVQQPELSQEKQSHISTGKNSNMAVGKSNTWGQWRSVPCSYNSSVSATPPTLSDVDSSSSYPVLVPSNDSHPGAVGAINCEVGIPWTAEQSPVFNTEGKPSAGKVDGKSQGEKNQFNEFSQPSSVSAHGCSSSSRPSSNYGSRSQLVVGPEKVGPSKEWKPKATNTNTVKTPPVSEILSVSSDACVHSQPVESVPNLEEATSNLQKELEDLHVRDTQHVILPNHIHVPEAVRIMLSFGSFDAGFVLSSSPSNDLESDKHAKPVSETPQDVEETVVKQAMSNHNVSAAPEEDDYVDHLQSPRHVPETVSSVDVDAVSGLVTDLNESKETPGGSQPAMVHTSTYSYGLVPLLLGNPLAQSESSEIQPRDVSRMPGLIQPVDPANLYPQFYCSEGDADGRISPFISAGVATKYNGNFAVLAPQTSQSPLEVGNSLLLSTSVQAPLPTQAAGSMQSSIAGTQQAIPVFRQPAAVHIPHYPPNYIPYGHYFSPFYIPSPAIHQFLGNNAFPQQGQAGSVYLGPVTAAATGVKYPLSQYKPGNNTGNSGPVGIAGSYGPYGCSTVVYNPVSAATTGNSTANEDLPAPQIKDSNMYITGQQANSFYNLPPQSPHVTFTPTQSSHGNFANVYHPAQAVTASMVHPFLQQSQAAIAGAVDMVGVTSGIYQPPQHAQMNWPNNY